MQLAICRRGSGPLSGLVNCGTIGRWTTGIPMLGILSYVGGGWLVGWLLFIQEPCADLPLRAYRVQDRKVKGEKVVGRRMSSLQLCPVAGSLIYICNDVIWSNWFLLFIIPSFPLVFALQFAHVQQMSTCMWKSSSCGYSSSLSIHPSDIPTVQKMEHLWMVFLLKSGIWPLGTRRMSDIDRDMIASPPSGKSCDNSLMAHPGVSPRRTCGLGAQWLVAHGHGGMAAAGTC